jgi:hypothetical protein
MEQDQKAVQLPAPTAWPIVLALGVTLLFAGLLTSADITVVGGVLMVAAAVGWFRDVLPRELQEAVPVDPVAAQAVTARTEVTRPAPEIHRLRIPVEIYPVTAGLKGGLAGSVAMAVLACAYGILSHGSIWYPINLLASVVKAEALQLPMDYLTSFHLPLFLVAGLLHMVTSILVGLLYGVMLPMFPRRPILLGGLIAPVMWSGLLYATLGIINPLLDRKIDWKWFIASQIGFGIIAGLVVVQQARVRTRQFLPFAVRAGIEAPGWMEEKSRIQEKSRMEEKSREEEKNREDGQQ